MIPTSPQLNSLRLAQQSFQKLIEPFIWNFIVGNNLEECVLRSMIALPMNNHMSPPPPVAATTTVAAIAPILMGHKKC